MHLLLFESIEAQELDRKFCFSVHHKVCQCFADDRREFESVSGKACGQHHVLPLRMNVDNEMLIG